MTFSTFKTQAALGALAFAAALSGCSKPKSAKHQQLGQLPVPDYQSAAKPPLMLTGDEASLEYNSNLLIWKPGVTPATIRAISDSSVQTRIERAGALQYKESLNIAELERTVLARQADAAAAKAALADYQAGLNRNPDVLKKRQDLMATWFETSLAGLTQSGQLAASDTPTAQSRFHLYCEAKIFELAIDPLAIRTYKTRPTPVQICETYFATRTDASGNPDKLLSSDSPACKDAPGGASYLSCLWQEGVMKTSIWRARQVIAGTDPDVAAVRPPQKAPNWNCTARPGAVSRQDWLTQGGESVLEAAVKFALDHANDAPPLNKAYLDLQDTVLNATSLTAADFIDFPGQDVLAKCPALFVLPPKTVVEARYSPRKILGFVESVFRDGLNVGPQPTLLPWTSADGAVANAADVTRYGLLADQLRVFGSRDGGPSVSDASFNLPVDGSALSASLDADFRSRPAFAPFVALAADPPELASAVASATAASAAAAKELDARNLDLDSRYQKIFDQLGIGASIGTQEGTALLLVPFTLDLKRVNNTINVALWFRSATTTADAHGVVGCVGLDGKACTALRAAGQESWPEFKGLQFDGTANEIIGDIQIDDPAALQLTFEPTDGQVGLLSDHDLRGHVLHLEAFTNRLSDTLDFYTGNAKIVDGGQTIYEGSVSGDAFSNDWHNMKQ